MKKVQKQDRIVEEVKLILKPAYNARKITKEAYKEILKKAVPKVNQFLFIHNISFTFISQICHSKHGEINPLKIEKLVSGYIKKYEHMKRKAKKGKQNNL